MRRLMRSLLIAVFFLSILVCSDAFSQELKIAITGQSYASLYPCACPREPFGGVARRATAIRQLRETFKNSVLAVEAGGSFASGELDPLRQDLAVDMRRTEFYLSSLKKIEYDALLVSSQEYILGSDFLGKYLKEIPFVSSNISGFTRPYVVKNLGWIKVGIIAVTDAQALSRGAEKFADLMDSLTKTVAEVKKQGATVVILLSAVAPTVDEQIVKAVPGIDLIVNGSKSLGAVQLKQIDKTHWVNTWWQAKELAIVTLDVQDGKVAGANLQSVPMSPDIADAVDILQMIPQCFTPGDCRLSPGMYPKCEDAATLQSRCVYTQLSPVNITVIKPKECRTCNTEPVIGRFRALTGGVNAEYLLSDEPAAKALIKLFGITMLPAYLFKAKDIESSPFFVDMKPMLKKEKDYYWFNPGSAGVSYLVDKKPINKRLDVFFDFRNPRLKELFELLKSFKVKYPEFDVKLNFLAIRDPENQGKFLSLNGVQEMEEFERIACVDAQFHEKVWDYVICRAAAMDSSWWDQCAKSVGLDVDAVRTCATSEKAKEEMTKRVLRTEEFQIASGPTFVLNNQEIFSMVNIPTLEVFEQVVTGQGPLPQKTAALVKNPTQAAGAGMPPMPGRPIEKKK